MINENILAGLNPQQIEAVTHKDGPIMVFAGAGTGKTKTLTSRVAYLIKNEGINPWNILAITFTKKATKEMEDRLEKMLGFSSNLNIDTIHAMCAKILRRHIDRLGYSRSFIIIDEDESLKIINQIYKDKNIDRKRLTPKTSLNMIGAFKNNQSELIGQVKDIYDWYQEELQFQNLVDFDDLLILTEKLFVEHPDVLKYYQDRFHYILVDEFQDTNVVQYNIIKMLASDSRNLFVVGDDDQSIYRFRGATVENMFQFEKDFPERKKVVLEQNYRSSNTILKGANRLINNNQKRQTKELYSSIEGQVSDVVYVDNYNQDEEARYVAGEIKRLVKSGYQYEDIAVLYRTNVISRIFELCFIEERIPYHLYGGFSYLKRKEIKDIISYFGFIIDPTSVYHFSRIINQPSRGIGEKTVNKIVEHAKKNFINIFDAIVDLQDTFPQGKKEELFNFKSMIEDFQVKIEEMTLPEFFDYMLETSGYLAVLISEDQAEVNRVENVKEFKSILVQIDEEYDGYSQTEKIKFGFDELILSDTNQVDEDKKNQKGVVLSTVHSVKGLEFKVVFVVALEEGIFPNHLSSTEPEELEEERRVAYVAFTRAKEKIYLSCAYRRLIYGRYLNNKKSRFFLEYIGTIDETPKVTERPDEKEETEATDNQQLKIGDQVVHKNFGDGIVIATDPMFVQVIFLSDKKSRKLLTGHPALRKK